MTLPSGHGVSEIHIVGTDDFVTELSHNFITILTFLPDYIEQGLCKYNQYINIYLYRSKYGKPYRTGFYCSHMCNNYENNRYELKIKCSEVVANHPYKLTQWTDKYSDTMRFGIQDYYENPIRPWESSRSSQTLSLRHVELAELYGQLWTDSVNAVHMSNENYSYFTHYETIDRIREIYVQNRLDLFEAVRQSGYDHICIDNQSMSLLFHELNRSPVTFPNTVSHVINLLGGLAYSSANEKYKPSHIYHEHIGYLFAPDMYGKVFEVWDEAEDEAIPDDYLEQCDVVGDDSDKVHNNITRYNTVMKHKKLPPRYSCEVKTADVELYDDIQSKYDEYLDKRDLLIKQVGKYLYQNRYTMIHTYYAKTFQYMVFTSQPSCGEIAKLIITEDTDEIKGPWIKSKLNTPLVKISCEDDKIDEYLKHLPIIKEALDLLSAVRYNIMAVESINRLSGVII